jgi:hypothetical protein
LADCVDPIFSMFFFFSSLLLFARYLFMYGVMTIVFVIYIYIHCVYSLHTCDMCFSTIDIQYVYLLSACSIFIHYIQGIFHYRHLICLPTINKHCVYSLYTMYFPLWTLCLFTIYNVFFHYRYTICLFTIYNALSIRILFVNCLFSSL